MQKEKINLVRSTIKSMETMVNEASLAPERDEDPEKWSHLKELLSLANIVAGDLVSSKGKLIK